MVMHRIVAAGIAVAVILAAVPPAQSAERKKKAKPAPASETRSAPTTTVSAAQPAPPSPAAPDAPPPGWTAVKSNNPSLGKVFYKIDDRDIIVRFQNVSDKSPIRVKYTAKWKRGQNNVWRDDSTMEGISFRLKPLESLDREIRTRAPEIKDVVIEVDITETS